MMEILCLELLVSWCPVLLMHTQALRGRNVPRTTDGAPMDGVPAHLGEVQAQTGMET